MDRSDHASNRVRMRLRSPKEVERREARWVESGLVAALASASTKAALCAIQRLVALLAVGVVLALPLPPRSCAAKLFELSLRTAEPARA